MKEVKKFERVWMFIIATLAAYNLGMWQESYYAGMFFFLLFLLMLDFARFAKDEI